ncbi:E3 SUMO-protein ligase ZBED1-like [Halichoeres trimaculatus]|uniref:E3 SUMO-protein ligase ZBED1-like n=1 Tax=Halichoeres trimaculatus TaxID=147232 RepID=UPI003D9DD4D2
MEEDSSGKVLSQSQWTHTQSQEAPIELVPKRGGTSVVWLHFGFNGSDTEQKTAVCKLCHKVVPSPDANTTNLFYHLQKKHEREYTDIQKFRLSKERSETGPCRAKKRYYTQRSLQESFARGTPYDKNSRRHQQLSDGVTRLICKGGLPIELVDKPVFRELMELADPRYIMPSRKHFTRVEVPRLYAERRTEVAREINRVAHYSLTTDLWTSRQTEPYMCITIHFIDNDWTLCSRCLQTAYFPQDHTGAMIAQGLTDALESWGLEENQLVCVTTDNATNNISALEQLEWERLQCFGHRLQRAIDAALRTLAAPKKQAVERAVGICKKVVSAFSNSTKRKHSLAKAQAALGLPFHQLITETPTRWSSRQHMIARFLEQEKALSQVLLADKKARHLVPSWQDMALLESVSKALGPLVEFTDALSGEMYVSVSFLKPVLHLFNNEVLSRQDGDTELTEAIREGILNYLNEKYDDEPTNNILDMATLVDPRFKLAYTKEDRVEFIKTRAAAEMEGMLAPEHAPAALACLQTPLPTETAHSPPAESDPELPHPTKKIKKSLGSYFRKAAGSTQPQPTRASIELELNMYLQVQSWFPARPLPFQPTDRETDTRDSHNKHLELFPSTSVINEPGYPQSSRVSLDARSGFVTNGAL